uniref:Uncharacterized protein n=1 Tax=Physcomitrium patens TaxID=3218 RepID=A0A2K1L231_PHYPA|nr:hypothetical protein PHYPA_002866 [Physcomitrium patens]
MNSSSSKQQHLRSRGKGAAGVAVAATLAGWLAGWLAGKKRKRRQKTGHRNCDIAAPPPHSSRRHRRRRPISRLDGSKEGSKEGTEDKVGALGGVALNAMHVASPANERDVHCTGTEHSTAQHRTEEGGEKGLLTLLLLLYPSLSLSHNAYRTAWLSPSLRPRSRPRRSCLLTITAPPAPAIPPPPHSYYFIDEGGEHDHGFL